MTFFSFLRGVTGIEKIFPGSGSSNGMVVVFPSAYTIIFGIPTGKISHFRTKSVIS